jgi:hypothetical protein
LTTDEAIGKTVAALQAPVTLSYLGRPLELLPDQTDFRLNEVVARLQLDALIDGQQGLDKLPAFMLRQYIGPTHLATPYQYSEAKLQDMLNAIAQQNNREARPTTPDLASAKVAGRQEGTALNRGEATDLILAAMASGISRTVDLPVDVIPLDDASVKALEPLVQARLQGFNAVGGNVAGVFIKDLRTGAELALNGDVAFSAQGWLKVPIILEAYYASTTPISDALRTQLVQTSAQGSDIAANEVLRLLGDGDAQRGLDQLNTTLHKLGLRNTFLAQPFGQPTAPPTFITPANSRGDISASPQATAQSTVADMGVLLEMIGQCRAGSGALGLALGEAMTTEKCAAMLEVVGENKDSALIKAGSGDAIVLHRQSWDDNNHGDIALVRSPAGDYVIAIMLHGGDKLDWANTAPIISDISRLAYGFFNESLPPSTPAPATPSSP